MTTPANPFIVTPEDTRRDPYVDVAAVAKALAETWGATLGECEPGSWGIGRIVMDDLVVTVTANDQKAGGIRVYTGAPTITRLTGTLYDVEWPAAKADTGKGIEKLAADLKRRVLDPAAESVAAARAKLATMNTDRENLERHAAALTAAFPFLDIRIPEGVNKWEAPVYVVKDGVNLMGRLNSDGGLYLDRLSIVGADRLPAFLAVLFGAGEVASK
ncbi:hypothetical protein [Sphingomonas asaccharolytica]|uniref:hypothetical protein n=1 Tax=Sphingomonas asaccharolytica TaxID=40681 RepID=UPI0008340425|nr:hypothetical protein [Sphingomonas asaccharolytica]